jgi:hypothetical protein
VRSAAADRPAATPPAAPSPSGQDRRLAAMIELVMHQTRTISALNARLTRLEARLADLLRLID